jgi:hypothetical protein
MMTTRLDTPTRALYKPRPLSRAAAGLLVVLWAGAVAAETVNGAHLPDGAQKVGENRYRASDDFKGTLKHYDSVYPKSAYPRRNIVNQPGVKAVHIVNPSGKNFEGLNIYEANDEVRIYIVPAGVVKAPKKKAEPKKK